MQTFLLVLAVFAVLLVAMSIGVIMGRKPISGTCGGIGALGMVGACDICGGDQKKCEDENDRVASEQTSEPVSGQDRGISLAYDAADKAQRKS